MHKQLHSHFNLLQCRKGYVAISGFPNAIGVTRPFQFSLRRQVLGSQFTCKWKPRFTSPLKWSSSPPGQKEAKIKYTKVKNMMV